jgi:four helix bundle protein
MGRKPIRSYRDLEVWQRGIDLGTDVYDLTERFPASEKYGLTSQVRRAVISIPSNTAEGWGYSSRAQYVHYLEQARSSLLEVEIQIVIAERLGYIDATDKMEILRATTVESKMLLAHKRSLQK